MACSPEFRICTAFCTPRISRRSVGPSSLTNQYAAQAITGICIRRHRESFGISIADKTFEFGAISAGADFVALFTAV
jgi:hypothetical protein